MRQVVIALLFTVLVASCGEKSSGPTAPSVAQAAGTWRGTINETTSGAGQLTLTIAQNGSTLSGTWASLSQNPGGSTGGTLSGTAGTSNITVTLTDSNPTNCSYNLTGPVSGSQMSLTYASFNCPVAFTGTVTLTKQ